MQTEKQRARSELVKLLQRAYSGEMAAALAYHGHWKSLRDARDIAAVRQIEIDEWQHRARLGEMLAELDAEPQVFREFLLGAVGRSIAFICRFCGRFCATYFAGVLEKGNVEEYQKASDYAEILELKDFAEDFREMRQTEADHETVLYEMIAEDRLLPYFAFFFGWSKRSVLAVRKKLRSDLQKS